MIRDIGKMLIADTLRTISKKLSGAADRVDGYAPAPTQREIDPLDAADLDTQPLVMAGGNPISGEARELIAKRELPKPTVQPAPLTGSLEDRLRSARGF